MGVTVSGVRRAGAASVSVAVSPVAGEVPRPWV